MANGGRRFCYTLDVLTDGSEHTGCGTLFLSVWKIPLAIFNTTRVDDSSDSEDSISSSDEESVEEEDADPEEDEKQNNADKIPTDFDPYSWLTGADESGDGTREIPVPLARYALSGLGDATARLCADQRFKLAMTRACFVPTSKQADGLSALLLALYGAGSPSLHLVVPKTSIDMEDLATLVLGAHKNMDIRTCEVASSKTPTWWRVYEDEHLIVHASSADAFLGEKENISLVFLYSFPAAQLGKKVGKNPYCTLALLPPRCNEMDNVYEQLMQQNRPMIRDDIPMTSIDYVIFLDPSQPVDEPSVPTLNSQILATMPRNIIEEQHFDEGILIKSQQLHRRFFQSLPHAFAPPPPPTSSSTNENDKEQIFVLNSGTSIVLEKNSNIQSIPNQRIWDRRKSIWKKEPKAEWTRETLESLQSFVAKKSSQLPPSAKEFVVSDENEIELDDESIEDENEIDLDEEDESSVEEKDSTPAPAQTNNVENSDGQRNIATYGNGPRLVVLGTGCATPSAYRGSSGYALVLPTNDDDQIYLLDCGEGVSTMLSRNCGDWKQRIRGIWISHAHLDHYGGLPTLLQLLLEERNITNHHDKDTNKRATKRPRRSPAVIPWVVAPRKVLRYIDLVLGCQHGFYKDGTCVYMQPNQHHDPRRDAPFIHFESIKVHHNCCPAFGLLVGWKKQNSNSNQFLCYSGDTRPCKNLVRACNRAILQSHQQCQYYGTNHYSNSKADLLLIHEATFRDAEATMAQTKKHSTLSEALEVATDISACSRVLMTHFSQRYDNVEGGDEWKIANGKLSKSGQNNSGNANTAQPLVGLAVDGLWINLD